ncbi:ABC transporter substrate-binding protein [Oceanicella sp. SM1341]|uniref:ABC transporter substrate-binding protein n=1 Tax=Oceanicella sp. SM1341 TaxID=1548889 RepID=UPI001E4DF918|nr:ABC transporter substrate-binding protein [Oceanicella sp. SM1341]
MKHALSASAALMAGGMSLAGMMALPALAQDSLTFTSYGGTYQEAQRKALLDPVEEEMGITIREDTLTGIAEVRAQVLAGAVTWDIVDLGVNDCALAQAEGLFEPLDYSIISTEGFKDTAYAETWAGTIYYSTTLAYNPEYLEAKPQSWADFWDVENFPGARALQNTPGGNLEIALMADGVAPEDVYPMLETPEGIDRAFAKLEEIKPDIAVWWTTGAQSAQLIADGEVDMESIWNGRLDAVKASGVPAEQTFNQAILALDCLAIPKGAPNKDLAMKVLGRILAPDLQANLPALINYGPTTSLAFDEGKITEEQTAISPSAPENIALQLPTDPDFWAANRPAIQERWDAFMTQ